METAAAYESEPNRLESVASSLDVVFDLKSLPQYLDRPPSTESCVDSCSFEPRGQHTDAHHTHTAPRPPTGPAQPSSHLVQRPPGRHRRPILLQGTRFQRRRIAPKSERRLDPCCRASSGRGRTSFDFCVLLAWSPILLVPGSLDPSSCLELGSLELFVPTADPTCSYHNVSWRC